MANRIYKLIFFLIFGISLSAQNCDLPVPLSDDCADAPIFCGETLNNYCSSTGTPNTFNPSIANGCNLENSIWLQIPVCETAVNLSILVDNCQLGTGLDVMLASSTDCQNFTAENPGCFSLNPNSQTDIQFSNLTPDSLYYLIIDGNTADFCDFTVEVIDGIPGLDTIPPDTTSATPYMWQVVTPAYIEGEPNACVSDGMYRLVPAVCELVQGNCLTGGDNSGSRMAGCDIPDELCPPPIPTQFDTIVHWNIPPCVEFVGDTTSLEVQLDFTNYIECYINSGMQPWPVDTIPFNISAELELIPIPDTTNNNDNNIYCDCQGLAAICNSCPSGAGLDGFITPNIFNIDFDVCPPCDNTSNGFFCVGDQFYEFPDACTVIITDVFPLPNDPMDFGVQEICPGECISVDTEVFCGEGTYNWLTINQFGCEVPATVTIVSPAELTLTGTAGTITCEFPSTTICVDASGGSGPYSYDWAGFGFFSCITVTSGGTYTCTVTDNLGCTASMSITVIEDTNPPNIDLTASPTDTLDNIVSSIVLTATSSVNPSSYEWSGPLNNPIPSGNDEITITEPGTYNVTVTNENNGCSTTQSIDIYSNYPPLQNVIPLGDSCNYAPYFCAEFLDGAVSNNQNATPDNLDLIPGCPMDNSVWLSFSTCDTTAQLSFFVDSCVQAQGLEFSIVSTVDCDSFEVVGTSCQTVANGSLDTLTFDSLEIGNIYYLIIDGIAADICDFEIGVIGGIAGGLDSLPPPDSITNFRLEQLTDGSIDGPTPVCAFTQNTYTFNPGTCTIVEGDCNRAAENGGGRADPPCDNGCFPTGNIELDTLVDWTLPNGSIVHGDSTDFDITLEFGLDFLLDQYNGMIPSSDTDTIVVTLMADYSIVPVNDTISQDSLGTVYCHCPLGIICGSCETSASFDVQVIIIFDQDNRTTCVDECEDACGQELCPGESVYCTAPCVLTTVSLTLVPIDQIDWFDVIDCFSPCVSTPYGVYCAPGVYFATEDCAEITITIIEDSGSHITYPQETICPGNCVTVGNMTFCSAGDYSWDDPNGCDTYSVQVVELNPAPIDYGTVTLCPNDCFIANSGQTFCTAGVHNFIEFDANGCDIDATVNIEFNNVSDVDLGTVFLCDGECYPSTNGPLCTPGIHTWTEMQNGCTVNFSIDLQFFINNPIDYGVVTLCPNECFTANDGQQFCTAGIHNFSETDLNGCLVAATVEIIMEAQAALSIGLVSEICNQTGSDYTVNFTIYGDPPFSVNGIEIVGDFYSSADIPSGNGYSF